MEYELSKPATAICTYLIKSGKEAEFEALLRQHAPTLQRLGLVESTPSQIFRGKDKSGGTFFLEILIWKNENTPNRAHQIPDVMVLWEPMGMCCESRLGRDAMDFPQVTPVFFKDE